MKQKEKMHNPSVFKQENIEVLHELIVSYPLATLITSGPNGVMANLIPFTLHKGGEHGILRAHLARGNAQLKELADVKEALVVFTGPHVYVTPSWYPSKQEHGKMVPTWNYTMVQVRGTPKVIDDPMWTLDQIEALTHQQEKEREIPWHVSDSPADFIETQLTAIVGLEIPIQSIAGKFKISQNRLPQDKQGVINGLENEGLCPAMHKLMIGTDK